MKTHTKLVGLGLVGMLALSPAFAAPASESAMAPKTDVSTDSAMTPVQRKLAFETSQSTRDALQNVHAARIALFEGNTDMAGTLTAAAADDLSSAQKTASDIAIKSDKTKAKDDMYVPFESSVGLAEGFVPTDANKDQMAEAGKHLAKGDQQKALEVLKLANVDVDYMAYMLPINGSVKHAQQASDQIAKGDYYQANMSLKAIEDSIVADNFDFSNLPAQGGSAG
ncbi:YfdX family protein [Celeribacter neptunius]|uniref:YfdX protein n=1 Tax=Celeribacter neptunius TaxID=588602 RepID=A0A1I3USU7_9RHOB|nr:YfdX family protein [Celeribacter neptunius]SFJ85873.1 YfdX protein [Celeribacter neptunius]